MDQISVSTTIARPREEVFDYLADIANHAEFSDHYLVDWHLTREDSHGQGAGARFRMKMPFNRFGWADMTFVEVQRPHRIVARGRGGKYNRISMLGSGRSRLLPAGRPRSSTRFRPTPRSPRIGCWRRSEDGRGGSARSPARFAGC